MFRILCLSAFLLISATACKTSQTATSESNTSNSTTSTEVNQDARSAEELEQLYWARLDSAKMNFTKSEVAFMTGMIGHHAQALIMSDLAPENNASPAVQTLAARIINAQRDEIQSMQTWLRERDQPVPEVHIEGLNLMIHGGDNSHMGHNMEGMEGDGGMDHSMMPGMLTQEQLVELSEAKGTEFDRKFLAYMIQHHTGAITMVKDLINSEEGIQDETAFKLASDINVDQITEIERMKLMLSQIPEEGEL